MIFFSTLLKRAFTRPSPPAGFFAITHGMVSYAFLPTMECVRQTTGRLIPRSMAG